MKGFVGTLAMAATAASTPPSPSSSSHHHILQQIYDPTLLSAHEFSDFSSFVQQHRSTVRNTERIPILGCGPTDSVQSKEESLRLVASYVDLASVLHDLDRTCLVAHMTTEDMKAQGKE
jgi:hypothetical protein